MSRVKVSREKGLKASTQGLGIPRTLKGGLNVSDHMEVDIVSLFYISEPNSFR